MKWCTPTEVLENKPDELNACAFGGGGAPERTSQNRGTKNRQTKNTSPNNMSCRHHARGGTHAIKPHSSRPCGDTLTVVVFSCTHTLSCRFLPSSWLRRWQPSSRRSCHLSCYHCSFPWRSSRPPPPLQLQPRPPQHRLLLLACRACSSWISAYRAEKKNNQQQEMFILGGRSETNETLDKGEGQQRSPPDCLP